MKGYTRVAFHLGAAKAALFRIGVCSSVIVLFDFPDRRNTRQPETNSPIKMKMQ